MAVAKRRNARRGTLGLAGLALVWLFGVWPPPVWWRTHWPRETAMMRQWSDRPTVRPIALTSVSPLLPRMVIIGEDSRFRTHHGIDLVEIADALGLERHAGVWGTAREVWRRRDRLRGASTITQQLAKNLFLSPSRNPLRKVKEAVTALRLELALPKDRILELYLGLVEFGPGIWGVDAAARGYFAVSPAQLTEEQAATLAATLPFPRSSNPRLRPSRMIARRNLILARFHGVDVYIPPVDEREVDSLLMPAVQLPAMPIIPPVLDTIPQDTLPRTDTLPVDSGTVRRQVAKTPSGYQ